VAARPPQQPEPPAPKNVDPAAGLFGWLRVRGTRRRLLKLPALAARDREPFELGGMHWLPQLSGALEPALMLHAGHGGPPELLAVAEIATSVLRGADVVFSWGLRRLLNLIPDVNRFDLYTYVANGFDIPVWNVLIIDNLIPLIGYLLPWAILAFYLMKYREIANPA